VKRYILLILPVLALSLLCACAPRSGGTQSTDPENPSQAAAPAEAASGLPEPCEHAEIYNDGQISVQLVYGMDYRSGKKTLILRTENIGNE
jgi:hypothetical protein